MYEFFFSCLAWCLPRSLWIRSYKCAHRYIRQQAKLDAAFIIDEANQSRDAIYRSARAEAIEAVKKQNRKEAQQLFDKHKAEGHIKGLVDGYNAAAAKFGLSAIAQPVPVPAVTVDLERPHANIYRIHNGWVLRIIVNGTRICEQFMISNRERDRGPQRSVTISFDEHTWALQLMKAIHRRDRLVGAPMHARQVIFDECVQAVTQPGRHMTVSTFNYLDVCEMYHNRLNALGETAASHAVHLGQDPEDRFDIEDKSILVQPWTTVYTQDRDGGPCLSNRLPDKLLMSFHRVGLTENRTVRDLLLVTADELTDTPGFGPVALRRLRARLTEYHLALWGDPLPPLIRTTREREQRAIDLGDT